MRRRALFLIGGSAVLALLLAVGTLVMVLLRAEPSVAAAPTGAAGTELQRSITVIGRGQVKTVPDTAIVNLGVNTNAPTAKEAFSENSTKMQALLAQLKEAGIADSDVQTSNLSIYMREGPVPMGMDAPTGGPGEPMLSYQASNMVQVTVREVGRTDEVLTKVLDAGANNVMGIAFSIAEPAAFEQTAREEALAEARGRAEAMAKASGATLGQISSISETFSGGPPVPYGMAAGAAEAVGMTQPGEQTVVAYVQVTYELE